MPKTIRMPSEEDLPRGPRRHFVETLYQLYCDAGRPPLQRVSERINELPVSGSASKETIRKILNGRTVPLQWPNVEAVFVALTDMAGVDPDRLVFLRDSFGPRTDEQPARELIRELWQEAFDDDLLLPRMETYVPPSPRSGGFGDEPPF
ncbi:hypothetical protein [Nocardiopsis rhodophaea]|uniref:hypothetical protein n=1 Tax=Nocardiopsis rhodophaea TaxID=280238 RepID=UPI0031D4E989